MTAPRIFPLPRSLALLLLAATLGCHDGGTQATPPGTPGDRNQSDRVAVQESALRADLSDRALTVHVPVARVAAGDLSGTLTVELISVDGATTHDKVKASYALGDMNGGTVDVQLTLPAPVTQQADLVAYNLRITDDRPHGLWITHSLLNTLPRYEVRLEGPAQLSADKTVSYRVRAHDPKTFVAVPNAPVQLTLSSNGATAKVMSGTTDAHGDAFFDLALAEAGSYQVAARALASGTSETLSSTVAVQNASVRALLTTDKPLYQPGQTVYLRSLALKAGDDTPQAGQSVRFEVFDAKGNKIVKRDVTSDAYGIAATSFQLATLLNLGTFKVTATVGDVASQKTFEVARYTLPKFGVQVTLDKPFYRAGDLVHGHLDAQYFFGKAVANGAVDVQAATLDVTSSVFQEVMGATTASGGMDFSVQLPSTLAGLPLQDGNALVTLHVAVTDAAGQSAAKDVTVTVAQEVASIVVVPEATTLVPGVSNRLYVFVTDPAGAPIANAPVTLTMDGVRNDATTDAFGQAVVVLQPSSASAEVAASVQLADGSTLASAFSFGQQQGQEHLIVRSDRAVYDVGSAATIELVTSDPDANVYVDWLNEGQDVDQRTLQAKDGKASFSVNLDSSLLGNNRIDAYVVDGGGNLTRAGRTVFVRDTGGLTVALASDKPSYTPGEDAKLTFSVTDRDGKPKVAALGVQVVDEALFSLVDAKPGLLRTYFELNDAFSTPSYQIGAPAGALESLVFDDTNNPDVTAEGAAQQRAVATFAALGDMNVTGLHAGSWANTLNTVVANLTPYFEARRQAVLPAVKQVLKDGMRALEQQGCPATSTYCQKQGQGYLTLLSSYLKKNLVVLDFWGNGYQVNDSAWSSLTLTCSGPDERMGTDDDSTLSYDWTSLGLPLAANVAASPPKNAGVGGAAFPVDEPSHGVTDGDANSDAGAAAPRVRNNFPETLYVNPEVITGPDGIAQVDVPLADSITQWRVSALANSADGELGGSAHGIKVFQEFFADIDFPATLTRGDEVSIPVAVYNYLDQPQTVTVSLQTESWYSATGPTTATVELAANDLKGVSFPVHVDEVGTHTLTVNAVGSARSDAVRRSVRVVPDGKAFPLAKSGSLAAGNVTAAFDYPATLVPGSGELMLSVFPAYVSSAIGGMDSILQEPSGCFEQTTSTTWPNVLVLDYLRSTKQLTTEIQLKAESYISAGYQRLLTFEHPTGGFSWFGTQDPKPFLSVTAFGVMEFADMSKVADVDPAMLQRTIAWLVGQQAADGTWPGDQTEFFSINTSVLRNTAFVVWALASAGQTGPQIDRARAYLRQHYADEAQDGYTLAMVANALAAVDPNDSALGSVFAALDKLKKVDGTKISWDAGETKTTFYSAGDDAAVNATALVAHALLTANTGVDSVKGALEYLAAARDQAGNFGSTQATVWTLRTLILAATKGTDPAVGTLTVSVDGNAFKTVQLSADQSDVMTTVDMSTLVDAGTHAVQLDFSGTGKLSYNLVGSYNVPWALTPPDVGGPLGIDVSYDRTTLAVNDVVSETVRIHNQSAQTANMVLVEVGIPPGFDVVTDDLDRLLASQQLSKYEVTPRQLILYVTTIAANTTTQYSYRLRATLPIKASDGGAKVYPYYEPNRISQAAETTLQASL